MKIFSFKNVFLALFFLVVLAVLLRNSYSCMDPDFGWHLQVGKEIAQTRQLPIQEKYNYTLKGDEWVDHEWLMSIVVFWIYSKAGYFGVNIFFAGIIILLLILLTIFTQKFVKFKSSKNFFIFLFQLIGLTAIIGHLGIRFQEITLLNLFSLLVILYYFDKTRKVSILFWLLPLFYFWACIHAGFLIGIFLLFLWMIVRIFQEVLLAFKKYEFLDHRVAMGARNLFIFAFFCAGTMLMTLITPYGIKLYVFLSDWSNPVYLKRIAEWVPMYQYPFSLGKIIYLDIVVLSFLLTYFLSKKTDQFSESKKEQIYGNNPKLIKIDLWQATLFVVFLVLAVMSRRNFPLFFVATFPMNVKNFSYIINFSDNLSIKNWMASILKACLIIILAILLVTVSIQINYTKHPFQSYCDVYPCSAVNFLKKHEEYNNLNIFNLYRWGGYLIWMWPERQLFIDGRLPKKSLLGEYFKFYDKNSIEEEINRYNIGLFLIENKKPLKITWADKYIFQLSKQIESANEKKDELEDYLVNSPNWKIVYQDNLGKIFVKNQ